MRKVVAKTFQFSLAVVAVAALSGCATMRYGTYEKVEVVTSPPGAFCKIYREGEGYLKAVTSPGAKYIMRGSKPITIVCSKDGYRTATLKDDPKARVNSEGTISNFANANSGLLIDASNDARYETAGKYQLRLQRI